MTTVNITVQGIPPSANHYVKHSRGRHFRTPEAEAFIWAVAIAAGSQQIRAKCYVVSIGVYMGKGDRGDVDNFPKVCLDALVKARVIDSDAKIITLHVYKVRDWKNPRTAIVVREGEL